MAGSLLVALVGLISDTHGYLDPVVLEHFARCDEIWHLGDFGSVQVADELAACRPLRGVWGNIDDESVRARFPEYQRFELEGVECLLIHIAGHVERLDRTAAALLKPPWPDVLACGHSHVARAQRDRRRGGMLFLNPGAAGHQGPHRMRTAALLQLEAGRVARLQILELGPRGRRGP